MSLAKSKYNKKNRNYTVDYSPEEIYGIIQTKKEDPNRAYKLAKLLQNSEDKGHLDDLEEVLYLADKLKSVEYTPQKSVNSKGFYYMEERRGQFSNIYNYYTVLIVSFQYNSFAFVINFLHIFYTKYFNL